MNQPTWSTDVFIPAKNGTTVSTSGIQTNAVPAGIYTVWLEGHSGNPYFQTRRYAGAGEGRGRRSATSAWPTRPPAPPSPPWAARAAIPIYVSTTNASSTKWGASGSAVTLGVDAGSFTDCSLGRRHHRRRASSRSRRPACTPTSAGSGALSTLTINTAGLAPGCYRFDVRAYGTNGDGQPVVHIQPVTFTVATSAELGQLRRHHRLRRLPDHRHRLQRHLRPCRERHLSRSQRPEPAPCPACARFSPGKPPRRAPSWNSSTRTRTASGRSSTGRRPADGPHGGGHRLRRPAGQQPPAAERRRHARGRGGARVTSPAASRSRRATS